MITGKLKVLSYWNLNKYKNRIKEETEHLKYYHIGI